MMGTHDHLAIERWTARAFESCGAPFEQATEAAAMLVRSELRGYKTHGLTRVAAYVERLRSGDMNPRPRMRHRVMQGGVVLDADGAMGQVAGPHAVRLGLEALRTSASVLVAVQLVRAPRRAGDTRASRCGGWRLLPDRPAHAAAPRAAGVPAAGNRP